MEVVHRREQEEEVVVEQRRRRPELAASGDHISSSSSSSDENVMNDGYKSEEEVTNKTDISEKSVYFDKNEGTTFQWSISGKNLTAEDVDIPKIVKAVINNQNGGNTKDEIIFPGLSNTSTLRSGEENTGKRENIRNDVMEESDEEVIELEFERAVEKVHTHTPHCPNCDSQITKVILRRKKRGSPRPEKPVDLFGCLQCFSIFIPSGNRLNPFGIFGSKGKAESTPLVVSDRPKSEPKLPVSEGGSSTNAEGSGTIKPAGNVFNLFGFFWKRREDEKEQDSQGGDKVNQDEESNNEEDKPGFQPGTTPSLPHLAINIPPDETDTGISDGVTDPRKQETEIKEEKSDKPQQHQEHDEERIHKTTAEESGKIDAKNFAKPPAPSHIHGSKSLEILKCIVYGGLIELITSLSVVSSAAASDTSTLNVIAIGLATLFSGLIVFGQNLMNLKNDVSGNKQTDKYQELLGGRGNFLLHALFAILSFLVFGLVPPITYGFAFYESDDKDYKILAVAAASFASVFLLAIAKAYVRGSEMLWDYIKTVLSYITMAISASGVSYAAGDLIRMLMERLGWFQPAQPANSFVSEMVSATPAWASY